VRAVLSNGFNRFHLAPLAGEIQRHGALVGLLTAGWPKGWQRQLARTFPRSNAWKRFLDRKEAIEDALVNSFVISELLWNLSRSIGSRLVLPQKTLEAWAFRSYAWRARTALGKLRPDLYHYRSCFGLGSVSTAKKLGVLNLCDQSIAHPRVLSYMVENQGRFPPQGGVSPATLIDRYMQLDLDQAEHVLVNSDFVKQTCVHAGMRPEKIHVIYLGVDEKFLEGVPVIDLAQIHRREKALMYAGGLQVRKGVWSLVEVFGDHSRNSLTLVGNAEPALSNHPKILAFQSSKNLHFHGYLSRVELAKLMTLHSIFVFPSLCEGSARVIFEAMACGCYIITTPNAGSIVEDGVHGRLIPPGDANALAAAIDWAVANKDAVAEIGWRNAQLIRDDYRQCYYGEKVMALYHRLLHQE
jgi:glycosyltransferase involved in cell wall biosynthesis